MSNETFVDYYTVLEVSPDADQAVIRASYMRLARLRHPDRNLDNPEATLLFQLLQQAYSILGDPNSRQVFDRERRRQSFFGGRMGARGRSGRNHATFGFGQTSFRQSNLNPTFPFHETAEEEEQNRQRLREEMAKRRQEETARRAAAEQERLAAEANRVRTPQEEAARRRRLEREARMKESGQRIREAAMRVRESALRFKEERNRKAQEEALWNAERNAFVEAEIRVMDLD
ncbi:unnamed protein product [Clonostachys byssicola]|uniref:J domain-containing protein n=1 Tax=Clonostachys byssicola TaxID=160290 RepID=A0A9N9UKQ4_9HYPO|nr:unnamed protein product [Clonostachys byssicola]